MPIPTAIPSSAARSGRVAAAGKSPRAAGAAHGVPAGRRPPWRAPAAWPEDRNLLRVQQVTLAELVTRERLERIHLLKLDVEGAEADVLAGAAPVLDRIERIVLEVHGPAAGRAVDRQLCTAGFRQVRWHQPAYVYYLREQACR